MSVPNLGFIVMGINLQPETDFLQNGVNLFDIGYNIYFSEGEAENNTVFIGNPIDKELLLKELEEKIGRAHV